MRAEVDFRQLVASYSHLQLDQLSALPLGVLDHVPSHRRPSISGIHELAFIGRLHVDDDGVVLLVRKPTDRPTMNLFELCSHVDAPVDHAAVPCPFHWWVGMSGFIGGWA